jgi:hypothetical protein
MQEIVILGSLTTNRDPMRRIHVFESSPVAFTSLEEAIRAAKLDYQTNINKDQDTVPQFRVYESSDPDGTHYALLEVSDRRGDMVFLALYKIIVGKYRWAETQEEASPFPEAGTAHGDTADMPIPVGPASLGLGG